jgi:hypothetical protein
MKTLVLLFITLLSFQFIAAQTDIELVENTIQNYIDGSSYNKVDILENAFAENASLYLTIRDTFKIITPKYYVGFFKNGEVGKFNGREGKILSIDVQADIATAKAQILIPARDLHFIDLFLLKKTAGQWKIISKTATRL